MADRAAGTGKFTRLLLPTGAVVLAIEPVEGGVSVAPPDASPRADRCRHRRGHAHEVVVTARGGAAHAFHWFDARRPSASWPGFYDPEDGSGSRDARDRDVERVQRVWAIVDDVERAAMS